MKSRSIICVTLTAIAWVAISAATPACNNASQRLRAAASNSSGVRPA